MMKNKTINVKSVLSKALLILIVILCLFLSINQTKATEEQEIVEVNGQKISYRDGSGYVYINKNHYSTGGEFRGVWVSPLTGDIGNYISMESYKSQMLDVIHKMEKYNLNVMIFHVRIMNDALYESKYNSWSSYYNTNPDWDMLPWLIEECHKHGIEFHAWMNPYRVTTNVSLSLEECARRHKATNAASNPKNLLKASSTIILNPGIPEVQTFLVDTCMELVENYDVDAIHFDDYFYAAGIDDSETIREYNTTGLSEADFRRSQVDAFIEKLSKALRAYNEASGRRVQLGIAPTGVWKNGNGVVTYDSDGKAISSGSRTSAYAHYGSPLYADTLKWINNNWIDYILPQTYWAITNSAGPYCDLVKWWNAACKNSKTNLYSSLGLYMSASGNASWSTNHYEGYQQIMLANTLDNVRGCSIYNYTSYAGTSSNPDKAFRNVKSIWSKAVYLPEIRTMERIIPSKVNNLSISKNDYGYSLSFDEVDEAKFYVIYRSNSEVTFDEEEIIDVIGKVGSNGKIEFTDYNVEDGKTYYYGVKVQSNSNTLGEGVKISTTSASAGANISIGEITGISLKTLPVEGKSASVRFDKILYPLGSEVNYDVIVAFYQGSINVSSKKAQISNRYGANVATFDIPEDTTRVDVKIKAFNNCGESIAITSYDVYNNLGKITNFDINHDTNYNSDSAAFIWNKLSDNVEYAIKYSTDDFEYQLLEVISSDEVSGFNVNHNGVLANSNSNYAKNVYYRIKASSQEGIAYSDVLCINQYRKIGEIENFKVNGDRKATTIEVEEGDVITLEWSDTNDKAVFTVLVSYDGVNFMGISGYNSYADTHLNGSKYECTIPVRYTNFVLFLKVEETYNGGRAESKVIKVFVTMDELYCDDVVFYLHRLYDNFILDMDIYK